MYKPLSELVMEDRDNGSSKTNYTIDTRDLSAVRFIIPKESGEKYPVNDVLEFFYTDVINNKWVWYKNTRCKYVNISVDIENKLCTIADRYGELITLEDLKYQNN